MPIYEYRCTSCGHQQEFLQKVTDGPMTVCTKCGQPTFTKMVTAAGFQLKGSGWYATDFKNSGSRSKPSTTGDSAKADSGGAESKGSSESAGSSESKGGSESKPSSESKSGSESKAGSESKGSSGSKGGEGATKASAGSGGG